MVRLRLGGNRKNEKLRNTLVTVHLDYMHMMCMKNKRKLQLLICTCACCPNEAISHWGFSPKPSFMYAYTYYILCHEQDHDDNGKRYT